MTQPPPQGFEWEETGRDLGATLGHYNAILVLGSDPVVTGRVAIGIARAQAMHRHVAVGDLFGESPPIQELVGTDDPHGIVDSFLYGVSLTRIAYPVADAGQLFVMPTGIEPPIYEELLPNPRWQRLAAGFREARALLILALPVNAPEVEKLVDAVDGAVVVGEMAPPQLPLSKVITALREPRGRPKQHDFGRPVARPSKAHVKAEQIAEVKAPRFSRKQLAAIGGVALGVVLASLVAWLAYRPLADSDRASKRRTPCDSAAAAAGRCSPPRAAPNPIAASTDTTGAAIVQLPRVANPSDSLAAAQFAVELTNANTQEGAILKLAKDGKSLPAATYSSAIIDGTRWFKVVTGAFEDRADADSLLAGLRRRKVLVDGDVVRLPYAFLIDSVPATAAREMIASYADHGQPVYALRQPSGNAWLLVGAFESLQQASLDVESIRASGKVPVLVYRKGRPF